MTLSLSPVTPGTVTLTDATPVISSTYGAGTYGTGTYGGSIPFTLTGVVIIAGSVTVAAVAPGVLTLTPA